MLNVSAQNLLQNHRKIVKQHSAIHPVESTVLSQGLHCRLKTLRHLCLWLYDFTPRRWVWISYFLHWQWSSFGNSRYSTWQHSLVALKARVSQQLVNSKTSRLCESEMLTTDYANSNMSPSPPTPPSCNPTETYHSLHIKHAGRHIVKAEKSGTIFRPNNVWLLWLTALVWGI